MKRKHIDAMREVRLWIGQVIVPAAGLLAVVMSNPEGKTFVTDKFNKCKNYVNTKIQKFKKTEES